MKSDTTLFIVLALGGLAALYLYSRRGVWLAGSSKPPEATTTRALMELIGGLPMVKPSAKGYVPYDPSKVDVGFVQGGITGAQQGVGVGAFGGPVGAAWGAGIGFGAGAIASFWV